MSFCVPDCDDPHDLFTDFYYVGGRGGKLDSAKTTSDSSSNEAAYVVPNDSTREFCWEDGQLLSVPHNHLPSHKQADSWTASGPPTNKPVPRGHVHAFEKSKQSYAKLDGCIVNRLETFLPQVSDDDMITWLQYPVDNDFQLNDLDLPSYSGNHAVSYLPSLSLEKVGGRRQCADKMEHHQNNPILVGSTQFAAVVSAGTESHLSHVPSGNVASSLTAQSAPSNVPIFGSQLLEEMVFSSQESQLFPLSAVSRISGENNLPSKTQPEANVRICSDVPGHQTRIEKMGICPRNQNSPETNSQSAPMDMSTWQQLENAKTRNAGECMSATSSVEGSNAAVSVAKETGRDMLIGSKSSSLEDPEQNVQEDVAALGCAPDTSVNGNAIVHKGDCMNRKVKDIDDSEIQSKDQTRLPQAHATPTKRSRAAEVHNKSERRRRERINEKLKALQELIPNSNKTDKASMLGEAIEYLKELQSQILAMSYRTGIAIPPNLQYNDYLYSHTIVHNNGTRFGCIIDQGAALSACSTAKSLTPRSMMSSISLLPGSGTTTNIVKLPENAAADTVVGLGANVCQFEMIGQHPFLVHANHISEPVVVPSQIASSYHQQFSQQANIQLRQN